MRRTKAARRTRRRRRLGPPPGKVPTGVVVAIVRRAWRERGYAASIDLGPGAAGAAALAAAAKDTTAAARATRVLAVPLDRRLPKVRISTRQAAALADQRIVVVVDSWPRDSPYPEGHYVRSLGKLGDADAETAAVLLEADVDDRPFAPAVHACVPPLPWSFDEREHLERQPHREDLRSLRVCSVDPPGCRDIDDALSCRALDPEGKFLELGVHIADVTSFLKPDTAMDLEARRRGTTTYLVQRRLDMLPKPLTEDICSLRGGVERLTFSVFFRFDAATGLPAPNVAPRFVKGVIKSDAALTYAEAQTMMDDADDDSPLANDLRRINRCARALRARRVEAGALTLASPEVRFELDKETSDPLDVGMYVTREANQMVEEMMLLANVASAEAILRAFPSHALLRRHPTPAERMFEPLLRACRAAGVAVDVSSSRALADSLDAAVRDDDPYFNTLLRIVATRCMSQAVYCVSGQHASPERRHYGLAAPLYTHFTSRFEDTPTSSSTGYSTPRSAWRSRTTRCATRTRCARWRITSTFGTETRRWRRARRWNCTRISSSGNEPPRRTLASFACARTASSFSCQSSASRRPSCSMRKERARGWTRGVRPRAREVFARRGRDDAHDARGEDVENLRRAPRLSRDRRAPRETFQARHTRHRVTVPIVMSGRSRKCEARAEL